MKITGLDHFVLTVTDIDRSVSFYTSILGLRKSVNPQGRTSLHFGSQKINLHLAGAEFQPCALRPEPGSADLCFIVDGALDDIIAELAGKRVQIIEGPVERTGARGSIESIYLRDPDGNLLELSQYR